MRTIFTFLTLLLTVSLTQAGTLKLSENGQTGWKIALPANATVVEKTAARELAEHLKLVTGAEFLTVSEAELSADAKNILFVGNGSAMAAEYAKAGKNGENAFQFDEIFIRADGQNLYLGGHARRGALYAVYSFLQDSVGVRWWTAESSFIPQKPTLEIADDLSVSYAPRIISREMYNRKAAEPVFSARMKGNSPQITDEYGGKIEILYFVHSFYKVLPPEKYFDAHPEWYAEIYGERRGKNRQLCLTNEEMRKEYIRVVLEELRKHPETRIVDVSQNDCQFWCQCEKCKVLAEREGSQAGPLITFVNQVAEAIEKEFPDVLVETLAYQKSRKPPKTVRPRDNVLIRLCSIECSFSQPLDTEQNKEFADDLKGWSEIAKRLFIWDYVTSYNSYVEPFPNLSVLAPNLRFFVNHGAIGLFAEGEGDDFSELKDWLLMRLMWEPNLDENALIKEFCDDYYGPEITPFVLEYWKVLSEQAVRSGAFIDCFHWGTDDWLDLETLNRLTEIMNQAVAKSREVYGEDSARLTRIQKSKMAIDLVWIVRWPLLREEAQRTRKPFNGPEDRINGCDELAKMCQKVQTFDYTRGVLKNYFEGLKKSEIARKDPPEPCRAAPPEKWHAVDSQLLTVVKTARHVEDPASVDGMAVRIPTEIDWDVQYIPTKHTRFHVWVSMRADAELEKGLAGEVGVYQRTQKKNFTLPLQAEDLRGPNYHWFDLGVHDFPPSTIIWFAHRHNPKVEALYVDRIILLEE